MSFPRAGRHRAAQVLVGRADDAAPFERAQQRLGVQKADAQAGL
nr:hypothetical protein [Bordetella hinzii]